MRRSRIFIENSFSFSFSSDNWNVYDIPNRLYKKMNDRKIDSVVVQFSSHTTMKTQLATELNVISNDSKLSSLHERRTGV